MQLSPRARILVSVIAVTFSLPGQLARSQTPAGQPQPPMALDGYCAVCLIKGKQWVQGRPEHVAVYDGRTYLFPSAKERQMFLAKPEEYVPVLNGDCIVCYAMAGARRPGSLQHGAFYGGRIYLFPGDKEKQMFLAEPRKYTDADIAAGGNCVVCQAHAGKQMPGRAEFTAIHNGLRYLFPSDKERQIFLQTPERYAVAGRVANAPAAADPPAARAMKIIGRTGCAACEHRVHPLRSPDELGLSVTTQDGQIYIIEEAHRLYPKLYEQRFDGFQVEVTGSPIKSQGKFVWIEPTSLRVLQN